MTGLVFPASAGINRYVGQHRIAAFCVPRVSGDKPAMREKGGRYI